MTAFSGPTTQGGSVSVSADGSFSYTPPAGYTGADSFSYTITNAAGSAGASVQLEVGDNPVAVDDPAYTTLVDTPLSVAVGPGLLANDLRGSPAATLASFGGGSLPGTATSNLAGATVGFGSSGALTVNADGSFTFTPDGGFTGLFSFSYRITNSFGSSDATVTIAVQQAPAITSANSATFVVGQAGSFTVSTSGFPTPALSESGALPSGVTFTDHGDGTATLAGTPGAGTGGSYSLTLTASNGVGANATQSFTLTVQQAPAITSANSATFVVGQAGSFTVTTSGFPLPALSESGALPSGVTFTDHGDGTATLAGTPGAGTGGSYSLTLMANNGVGTNATQSFTLTVNQVPAITSANSATFVVGQAGSFTVTTSGLPTPALSETGALPSGVTFTDHGDGTATLAGTPGAGAGGSYSLTLTANNGVGTAATQSFTLTVQQAPAITSANSATFVVGQAGSFTVSTSGFPTPALSESGALPSGVTFTDHGDGTATLAGTPGAGAGGSYSLTLTANNGVGTAATQSFTLTVQQAPAITSANSATFVVGQAGSFTVTTSGFPTPALSESGALPSGVTFTDHGDGTATLAGTPGAGAGGSYSLTLTANNGVGTAATQSFTLTVQQAPAISSANSTTFTVGQAGSFTVTTSGFPTPALSESGALPSGVTFTDHGDGTATLAGTPGSGTAGGYNLVFNANNGVGTAASQNFTLNVVCPVISLTPAAGALTGGTYGVAYSQSFVASGGNGGYTYDISAGALPSGLSLASGGALSGSPSNTGNFSFTVRATDGFGCSGGSAYSLQVRPNAQNESFSGGVGNTQYVVGSSAPATPAVFVSSVNGVLANDSGPGTLSVAVATGPTNGAVSLGSNGTFTYTPNLGYRGASDSFTYTLTDGNGMTATATVTIGLSGMVWYVDGTNVGTADGRSHQPYPNLSSVQAVSAANDYIFVRAAGGAGSDSITLQTGQQLIGAGAGLSLNSLSIPATTNPTIDGTVTLANSVTVSGLNISTSGASALVGSSVSGVVVNGNVAVNSSGATAVSLSSTGGTFSLLSVSSSGAVKGIALSNTTGSFTVTGAGTTDGSGGTIQNISGRGVELLSAANVSLSNLRLTSANTSNGGTCTDLDTSGCNAAIYASVASNLSLTNVDISGTTAQEAINGINVSGFSLTNSTITSCGDEVNEGCLKFRNLTGTAAITGSDISFPAERSAQITNSSGTLNLTVSGSTFRDSQSSALGADGLEIGTTGTAVATISIDSSSFLRNKTNGLQVLAEGTSNVTLNVTNSTFDAGTGPNVGIGMDLSTNNSASLTYNVIGNPLIRSYNGSAVNSFAAVSSTIRGRITGNTIQLGGAGTAGTGVRLDMEDTSDGIFLVDGNVIGNVGLDNGIQVFARNATSATASSLDATITNNTVTMADAIGLYGIETRAQEFNTVCANVANNTVIGSSTAAYRARINAATATLKLQGFTTNATTTWASNGNTPVGSVSESNPSSGTLTGGTCRQVSHALPLRAAGGVGPGAPEGAALSQARLASAAAAALASWRGAGLSAAELARMGRARFVVGDLAGDLLGATTDTIVQIDRDAAGWGWSFGGGRMDLETAVRHELGHVIGRADEAAGDGLMAARLPAGASRSPLAAGAPAAAPLSVPIGTLPAGKRVVVTFEVTIVSNLPASVTALSNQASVSADGQPAVLSDDPRVPGAADPTVTSLNRGTKIYLPLVIRPALGPDLIVESIRTSGRLEVVIRNIGDQAVTDPFWVDLYLNPSPAPTAVNQIWPGLASQGATWGVTGSLLPIAPGGRVTLRVGDGAYQPGLSNLPASIPAGAQIYAQADSANATPGVTYGAVLESHERLGGAYNNILGPLSPAAALPAGQSQAAALTDIGPLPPRPAAGSR